MEIIKEEVKEFWLVYESAHGDWYEFPCDEMGHVLLDECPYPDTAEKSLAYCKARQDWAKNGEVVTTVTYIRYGICPHCGRRVFLGRNGVAPYMECGCECGQWYNGLGQQINKPPEDWHDDYADLYNDWRDDSYKYWYDDCDDWDKAH